MHEAAGGLELIIKGGFMMIPLLVSAVLAITVILERFYTLQIRLKAPPGLVEQILGTARSGDWSAAEKACAGVPSPTAAVLAAGLRSFLYPREEMELAMKNEAERWVPKLEKRIELI